MCCQDLVADSLIDFTLEGETVIVATSEVGEVHELAVHTVVEDVDAGELERVTLPLNAEPLIGAQVVELVEDCARVATVESFKETSAIGNNRKGTRFTLRVLFLKKKKEKRFRGKKEKRKKKICTYHTKETASEFGGLIGRFRVRGLGEEELFDVRNQHDSRRSGEHGNISAGVSQSNLQPGKKKSVLAQNTKKGKRN